MSDLTDLYQEMILDHSRKPHNFRTMDDASKKAEGYNPLCGDQVTVFVKLDGEKIQEATFQGQGCAISKSSASIMTDTVKGKTRAEAEQIFERFHHLVTEGDATLDEEDKLAVFLRRLCLSNSREMRGIGLAHAPFGAGKQAAVHDNHGVNMVAAQDAIKLSRDTEVVQIPEGFRVRLARGTSVRLMQALGDTFTVMTEYNTLVRIDGKDADVIGQATPSSIASVANPSEQVTAEVLKDRVWQALHGVYDPEIPVNVVELGLVYKCEVMPASEGKFRVEVEMTLTAPGCGMGGVLQEDAQRRIKELPQVQDAMVNIVVDPPWNPSMMSEAARLDLGF